MVGVDRGRCGLPQGEEVYFQFSPMYEVTLDDEAKDQAKIPRPSRHFAWAYPALDSELFAQGNTPEMNFLAFGGYTYFDQARSAIGTNAIAPAPIGTPGLSFGRAQNLPKDIEKVLHRDGRFQEITLQAFNDEGASHFAWIRPTEFEGRIASPDGAFAYRFLSGEAPALYFPVVDKPVFTPDMCAMALESDEAWVVVRLEHPTIERVEVFSKQESFNKNCEETGLDRIIQASDDAIQCSRSTGPTISYAAWKANSDGGSIADPWILKVLNIPASNNPPQRSAVAAPPPPQHSTAVASNMVPGDRSAPAAKDPQEARGSTTAEPMTTDATGVGAMIGTALDEPEDTMADTTADTSTG